VALHPDEKKISVKDKTCLCTHMRNYDCWTCGHYTYRLKDTSHRNAAGSYQILTAEHIFHDYQFSTDNKITLPSQP
jgi:nitronate monooxygenase